MQITNATILPPMRPVAFNYMSAEPNWTRTREMVLAAEQSSLQLSFQANPIDLCGLALSADNLALLRAGAESISPALFKQLAEAVSGSVVFGLDSFPGRWVRVNPTFLTHSESRDRTSLRMFVPKKLLAQIAENACQLVLSLVNTDTLDLYVPLGNTVVQLMRIGTKEAAEKDLFLEKSSKKPACLSPKFLYYGNSPSLLVEALQTERREKGNSLLRYDFVNPTATPLPMLDEDLLLAEINHYLLEVNQILVSSYPYVMRTNQENIGSPAFYISQKNQQSGIPLPDRDKLIRTRSRLRKQLQPVEDRLLALIYGKLIPKAQENRTTAQIVQDNVAELRANLENRPIPYANYAQIMGKIQHIIKTIEAASASLKLDEERIRQIEEDLKVIHLRCEQPIFKFYTVEEFWRYVSEPKKFTETTLISDVLVPLFTQMGFGVTNYHGQHQHPETADLKLTFNPKEMLKKTRPRTVKRKILEYLFDELRINPNISQQVEIGIVVKKTRLPEMGKLRPTDQPNIYQIYGRIKTAVEDSTDASFRELLDLVEKLEAQSKAGGPSTKEAAKKIAKLQKDLMKALFQIMRGSYTYKKLVFLTPMSTREDDAKMLLGLLNTYLLPATKDQDASVIMSMIQGFFSLIYKQLDKKFRDASGLAVSLADAHRLTNWTKWFLLQGNDGPLYFMPGFGFIERDSLPLP